MVEKKRGGRKKAGDEAADNVTHLFGGEAVGQPPNDPDDLRSKAIVKSKGPERQARSKIRVSRRMSGVFAAVERGEMTMKEFVETLTPEELVLGRLKSISGDFRGRPPKWVPSEFHAACVRELMRRGDEIWRGAYLQAIKAYSDIAQDEDLDPAVRLKASQYIIERLAGKVPDRVEIAAADPWETIIGGIVAEAEDDAIDRASRVLGGGAEG